MDQNTLFSNEAYSGNLSEDMLEQLQNMRKKLIGMNKDINPLSRRETEILHLYAQNKSRGEIAKELFLNVETVKSHLRRIFLKLNVHAKQEAIQFGIDKRFL